MKRIDNDSVEYPFAFQQVTFLQLGFLLGKSEEELFARFSEKLAADVERELNQLLVRLENETGFNEDFSLLMQLSDLSPLKYPANAIQVLEKVFTKNGNHINTARSLGIASVWITAAGEDFLASYSRALRNADETSRRDLLRIEFSLYEEFQCHDPIQLRELLDWCDEILGTKAAKFSDELTAATIRMLTGLLVVNNRISPECRQTIVDRLETYETLTDANFWLAMTAVRKMEYSYYADDSRLIISTKTIYEPYADSMRRAMIQHAIDVLTDDANTNGILVCQALAILRSAVLPDTQWESEIKGVLVENLASRLNAVIDDPLASARLLQTPPELNNLNAPEFANSVWEFEPLKGSSEFSAYEIANEVILSLNLILALELKESLLPQITSLHKATENLVSTELQIYSNNFITWPYRGRSIKQQDMIAVTWFLQTGALLGLDFDELRARPRELYQADYQRRMRFVQPGDTLAIHIPDVLPRSGEPPVIQAGTSSPVTGFPVAVSAEGTIQLPLVGSLEVKDLELEEVHEKIGEIFVSNNILKAEIADLVSVKFLLRAGQNVELRNIAGSSTVTVPVK